MNAPLDPLRLTQDLVRLNTVNPPGNEEACARFLGELLEEAGFAIEYNELGRGRLSLQATIGGCPEVAPLCFTGHIDTVPLGNAAWSMDPFGAELAAGKLYGRGVSDMKSGVAAFVVAAITLAPHLSRGPGLVLVITAGEERGCAGAFHMLKQGVLGRAGAVVVAEPTGNYPFVGHKGALWLLARTRGVTAHGSMPECGVNAVYRAARAVSRLENWQFINPVHPLMGQATLNVGTFHGGLNINSVPDEALIEIDIRSVPSVSHDEIVAQVQQALGEEVELERLLDVPPVYTDPGEAWMREVFEVMAPLLGEAPTARTATFFTDAAALSIAYGNPPTVILGPGEPQMAHQTDEYCVVDRIGPSVAAFEEIIRRWCLPRA